MAPEASLLVYKVSDPPSNKEILNALDQALKDGAKVVNISLGKNCRLSREKLCRIDDIVRQGVVVVTAVGNDGLSRWSCNAFADSSSVIAVAADTGQETMDQITLTVGNPKGKKMRIIPFRESVFPTGELSVVDARKESFSNIEKDVKGKVLLSQSLLCDDCDDFEVLIDRARAVGAKALLLYNPINNDETIFEMYNYKSQHDSDIDLCSLPVFFLYGEDGVRLSRKISEGFDQIEGRSINSEWVAYYSSSGPVLGSWNLKPDVVAPGNNIESAFPLHLKESGKEVCSGTSMAAPFVTGAVALLIQAHPDWTPEQIKAALSNTAMPLWDINNNKSYSNTRQGAGRINFDKALRTKTFVSPSNISFGMIKLQKGNTIVKQIVLQNTSNETQNYTVSTEVTRGKKRISLDIPSSIQVLPNTYCEIPVVMQLTQDCLKDQCEGMVVIQSDSEELRVPFIVLSEERDFPVLDYFSVRKSYKHKNAFVCSHYLSVQPEEFKIVACLEGDLEIDELEIDEVNMCEHAEEYVLSDYNPGKGYYKWIWTGTDKDGKQLPQGYYVIKSVVKYRGRIFNPEGREVKVDYNLDTVQIDTDGRLKEGYLTGCVSSTKAPIQKIRWRVSSESTWKEHSLKKVIERVGFYSYEFRIHLPGMEHIAPIDRPEVVLEVLDQEHNYASETI